MYTEALVREVQEKLRQAIDGQTNAYLLSWGCALVAMALPLDDDADFPEDPISLAGTAMLLEVPPMLQGELALELPSGPPPRGHAEEVEWLLEPEGPVAPAQPSPPLLGADAETPLHGFLVITLAGECFWLTPRHLRELDEAGMLVYGRVEWRAELGLRSSPAPNAPLCDLMVTLSAMPGVNLGKRGHYSWSQYIHAKRHHQDLVLLSAGKPPSFPW